MKQLDGNRSLEIGATGAANLISRRQPESGLTSEQRLANARTGRSGAANQPKPFFCCSPKSVVYNERGEVCLWLIQVGET